MSMCQTLQPCKGLCSQQPQWLLYQGEGKLNVHIFQTHLKFVTPFISPFPSALLGVYAPHFYSSATGRCSSNKIHWESVTCFIFCLKQMAICLLLWYLFQGEKASLITVTDGRLKRLDFCLCLFQFLTRNLHSFWLLSWRSRSFMAVRSVEGDTGKEENILKTHASRLRGRNR